MAFSFDVNGTIPATGAVMLFRMKTLLKSVGWTVPSSSDGITYNSSGDQITSGGTGAGGFANANAWFRIKQPGANGREFTFQEQGGGSTFAARIKYSGGPGTGFTGGTPGATQTPSATDEQIIWGGGTDAAPSFTQFLDTPESNQRFNMIASDAGQNYVFLWWTQISGATQARSGMFFDVMLAGTFPAADQDPAVIYMDSFTTNLLCFNLAFYSVLKGWLKKNLVGAAFTNLSAMYYSADNGNFKFFPQGGGQNPHSGKDDLAPVPYGRDAGQTAPTGYKGISSFLQWISTGRGYGDTFNVNTTKDYLAVGAGGNQFIAIPWNGTDLTI